VGNFIDLTFLNFTPWTFGTVTITRGLATVTGNVVTFSIQPGIVTPTTIAAATGGAWRFDVVPPIGTLDNLQLITALASATPQDIKGTDSAAIDLNSVGVVGSNLRFNFKNGTSPVEDARVYAVTLTCSYLIAA
jgi:hypothetical protein